MTTRDILNERQATHGDFTDNAEVSQSLKAIIHEAVTNHGCLNDTQEEALDMICHKIGRIVCGNANIKDHWDDIAGYATLVSDRLNDE